MIVSVRAEGSFALSPPVTVPDTVTLLSSATVVSFTAEIVTSPVLVVAFAAMVSVVAVDRVKFPDAAGGTAAAETVIVVAALAVRSSVAVTVDTPPFSEIDDGASASVTCGVSSSVIISVRVSGGTTPVTMPETFTDFVAARTALSVAVIVTVPVLVVAFAAMVSVFALDRVKSPDAAGDTAVAETVIVVAVVAVLSSVAVTVVTPPFSEIDAGDKTNVAVGGAGNSANP